MTLKISIVAPAAAAGIVSCPAVVFGDTVIQVIDDTTGADVTSSFDHLVPYSGTLAQLDSSPSTSHNHVVLLSTAASDIPLARIAVVNSLGAAGGTSGPVTAHGVGAGDTIIKAFYGINQSTAGAPVDCTLAFAPTAPSSAIVTQIDGIAITYSIVMLLQRASFPAAGLMLGCVDGMAQGLVSVPSAANAQLSVAAGMRVLSATDFTNAADRTSEYGSYAPENGFLLQTSATTGAAFRVLFLLKQLG